MSGDAPSVGAAIRVGVDLGGTKTEAVALTDDGRVVARRRVATPSGDYDATIATIRALVGAVEDDAGARGTVGVGIPGSPSPSTGLVRNANSTWLNGRALAADLEASLARPVRLANDANCFALSEATDGAGAGQRVVFGVILGTGVGGGLVVDGVLRPGRNGIAGEWGHDALPRLDDDDRPVPRCWCGRLGCVETYLSGPALVADHRRRGGDAVDAADVARRAIEGDAIAVATMARWHARLAKALAAVVNLLDPDVVVIGGGLSNIASLYDAVPPLMRASVFADASWTPIVRNVHGDASGVRGAAWLWPRG